MSKCRLSNGDDHPKAAKKHLEDANVLHTYGRNDGAGYHAGYVIECCLKTLVLIENNNYPIWGQGGPGSHDIRELSSSALIFASLSSQKTAKYASILNNNDSLKNILSGWSASLRYRSPGAIDSVKASSWIQEAEAIYYSIIPKMLTDGVI